MPEPVLEAPPGAVGVWGIRGGPTLLDQMSWGGKDELGWARVGAGCGGCVEGPAHGLCSKGLTFRGQNRPCRGPATLHRGWRASPADGAAEAGGETGAFQCFCYCDHHRAILTGKQDSLLDVSESASLLPAAVQGLWGDGNVGCSSFVSVFFFSQGGGIGSEHSG